MVGLPVSCGEIIVDLDATTGELLILSYKSWRWRAGFPSMAKRNVALKPSRKPSRSVPKPRRGSDLKTGSLAPQSSAQARFDRRRACRSGRVVRGHAFQDRKRRRVSVDRKPGGAGPRAQRAPHHVFCEL